jgi:hypothetical protein
MERKETYLLHCGDERGVMEKTEMGTKTQGNQKEEVEGVWGEGRT